MWRAPCPGGSLPLPHTSLVTGLYTILSSFLCVLQWEKVAPGNSNLAECTASQSNCPELPGQINFNSSWDIQTRCDPPMFGQYMYCTHTPCVNWEEAPSVSQHPLGRAHPKPSKLVKGCKKQPFISNTSQSPPTFLNPEATLSGLLQVLVGGPSAVTALESSPGHWEPNS